ncbi:MAG: thioredoxin domain-containing protein [Chloroflexi bacterium]|nr:thioredoxin domain-containing protein [Chloroflexota bacterium]
MTNKEFEARIKGSTQPIVIDLWAPWCAPCRAMLPIFKEAEKKYAGKVKVMRINADESPEVIRALRVFGIPTVVGYSHGAEIIRRSGVLSPQGLDLIFDAAITGEKPARMPLAPRDRLLRGGAGLALLAIGWFIGPSWILLAAGAVVLFSAVYDRCPIYKAVAPRVAAIFHKSR